MRAHLGLFFSTILFSTSSCNGEKIFGDDDQTGAASPLAPAENPTHLVFSAIDVLASPWQSSLLELNLADDTVTTLSPGESGDPLVLRRSDQLFLFNRAFDSQNFRPISWDDKNAVQLGSQTPYIGGFGDPHDIVILSGERFLAANYTAGTLTIVNQNTGEVIETVTADWDLPEGVTLKPEAFSETENAAGEKLIFVVHQALSFKGGQMQVDGSQTAFVLRRTADDAIEAVDLDSDKPKIQGIVLLGSLPLLIPIKRDGKTIVLSMCQRYVIEAGGDIACHSAIEALDPNKLTAEVLWDLDDEPLLMNGPAFGGKDGKIFANVEVKDGDAYTKHVIELSPSDKTWKKRIDLPEASGGFWGAFQNPANGVLYVGDTDTSGKTGRFIVIDGEKQREVSLPLAPYSGAFVVHQ